MLNLRGLKLEHLFPKIISCHNVNRNLAFSALQPGLELLMNSIAVLESASSLGATEHFNPARSTNDKKHVGFSKFDFKVIR